MRGFQRTYLRGLAHGLEPVVQLGREGLTDAALQAVSEALTTHELIKVRLHRPIDKKELARALAQGSDAELCGLIGHTVILYRPHPEKPRIELPQREPQAG